MFYWRYTPEEKTGSEQVHIFNLFFNETYWNFAFFWENNLWAGILRSQNYSEECIKSPILYS